MSEKRIVLIGVDTPLGQKYLTALENSHDFQVVGLVFSRPGGITPGLFTRFPSLKALGLFNGTYDEAPEGVKVCIGDNADTKVLSATEYDVIADALDNDSLWKVIGTAAAKKTPLLFSSFIECYSKHPPVLKTLGPVGISMDLRFVALNALRKFGCTSLRFVIDGGALKDIAPKNIYAMKNKGYLSAAQKGVSVCSGLGRDFLLSELFEFFCYKLLTRDQEFEATPVFGKDDSILALGEKDGRTYAIKNDFSLLATVLENGKIEPEEYVGEELAVADKSVYPLFYYGLELEKKFGIRAVLSYEASFNQAVSVFCDGDLRLGDLETVIRRASSNVVRLVKLPKTDEDCYDIYVAAELEAKGLATKFANAAKNGLTSASIRKSNQANKALKKKNAEELIEHREHKKATRWKNNPEKQELWEEHKKIKARKALEAKKKAKTEAQRNKARKKTSSAFPVVIVDSEKADREKHFEERTQKKRVFNRDYGKSTEKKDFKRRDSYSQKKEYSGKKEYSFKKGYANKKGYDNKKSYSKDKKDYTHKSYSTKKTYGKTDK